MKTQAKSAARPPTTVTQRPSTIAAVSSASGAVPKQQSIVSSFAALTPYEKRSKRSRHITDKVSHFLAKHMMPISTVVKVGFKKLIKTLDCRYELLGRKYFSQTAPPKLYNRCRGKLENKLRLCETLCHYHWPLVQPYLGTSLTIHYAISQGLKDALAFWGISEDRQVCITAENGANIVKAVALKQWTHLHCFGHRLHLAFGKLMNWFYKAHLFYKKYFFHYWGIVKYNNE